MDKTTVKTYKRPAIDEDLYYQIVKVAADRKMTVKQWLEEKIEHGLKEDKEKQVNS